MTDKSTLILSWVLIAAFVPISLWNADAGMVVVGVAAMIRWDDIREADKAIKKSRDKYWLGYGFYLVSVAAIFIGMKFTGVLPKESSLLEGRAILLAVLLPMAPKFIKHEYNLYFEIKTVERK